jgi:hypothetical protein
MSRIAISDRFESFVIKFSISAVVGKKKYNKNKRRKKKLMNERLCLEPINPFVAPINRIVSSVV